MEAPNLSALSLIIEAVRLTKKSFWHWYCLMLLVVCLEPALSLPVPIAGSLAVVTLVTGFLVALRNADGGWPEQSFAGCLLRMTGAAWIFFVLLSPLWLTVYFQERMTPEVSSCLMVAIPVLVVYALGRMMLTPAVCCCEEIGPLEALRRAKQLMDGRFFTLVFAYLTSMIVAAFLVLPVVLILAMPLSCLLGASAFWIVVPIQAGFCCCLPLSVQMVAYLRIRRWELGLAQ